MSLSLLSLLEGNSSDLSSQAVKASASIENASTIHNAFFNFIMFLLNYFFKNSHKNFSMQILYMKIISMSREL